MLNRWRQSVCSPSVEIASSCRAPVARWRNCPPAGLSSWLQFDESRQKCPHNTVIERNGRVTFVYVSEIAGAVVRFQYAVTFLKAPHRSPCRPGCVGRLWPMGRCLDALRMICKYFNIEIMRYNDGARQLVHRGETRSMR
jgi:hypothetical protein